MAVRTAVPVRSARPPARTALTVLWAVVLVNLAAVEVLFVLSGTGKNDVLTVAKWFGLHAALVMMVQVTLVARIPWLDRRLGADRLTLWHRWTGFALLWTVLTHATLVVVGYAVLDSIPVVTTFVGLARVPASLLGMLAASVIVLIALASLRAARRRLPYEVWHAVHVGLYLAVLLALVHQGLEGTTFTAHPAARVYWWTLWTLVLGTFLVCRIGLPVVRNARHRFRVAAVVPEGPDAVSVYVTGRDLHRLPARAGQFVVWRFPDHRALWLANPFSLSAAPDGRGLRLTAKAVGTGSAGLRSLRVGGRVIVEGPYGAFTAMHQVTGAMLLVAGGIGVTPIRALLEETRLPAVVLYRVRDVPGAVLLRELDGLARRRGARLHVLTGRTGPGNDPFAPANLAAIVPDIRQRDVYVCGPPAMTEAVVRSARELGLPAAQVHSERFGLG